YASVLKSCGAGAPACPGMVAAINRVPVNAGSAITSAYERALHAPPGSSSTVCSAPAGPDSTSSHSVSTRADYGSVIFRLWQPGSHVVTMHAHPDRRPLGPTGVQKITGVVVAPLDQQVGVGEIDRSYRKWAWRR